MIVEKRKYKADQEGRVLRLIKAVQRVWADWMKRKTAGMPKRQWIVVLSVFLAFGIAYNVLILTGYWLSSDIRLDQIRRPVHVEQTSSTLNNAIIKAGKDHISVLRGHLDSLANSESGKGLLDSVLQKYPDLMDSLNRYEELLSNP